METFQLPLFNDMHVHVRQDLMLQQVLVYTMRYCRSALLMPNTLPPLTTPGLLGSYYREVQNAANNILAGEPEVQLSDPIHLAHKCFDPYFAFYLTDETTPYDVEDFAKLRDTQKVPILAGKLYPKNATTGSDQGVSDIRKLAAVFEAMSACNFVLCIHPEDPSRFVLDREREFVEANQFWLFSRFSDLRIVLEHITDEATVGLVRAASDRVAATITAHHLFLTLDDVLGDGLRPHNYCKPVAKRTQDREALLDAAMWCEKFFLGSDSAPHPRHRKEAACCAAGCFTAPVLPHALATLFMQAGGKMAPARLTEFTRTRSSQFYRLPFPNVTEPYLQLTRYEEPRPMGTNSWGDIREPMPLAFAFEWGAELRIPQPARQQAAAVQ